MRTECRYWVLIILLTCVVTSTCGNQNSRHVRYFEGTPAYELAQAVERADLEEIERIVDKDPSVLELSTPKTGSNVLELSIWAQQFNAFKKLLELGADPNYVNPVDSQSVLMVALLPIGSSLQWREDYRYAELLLEYGADPNYAIEEKFRNNRGSTIIAMSPLARASGLNLGMVRTLIDHGADYRKRIDGMLPLGFSIPGGKFEIIYYYTDSLNMDVTQPIGIRSSDSLYIQDFINKFMKYPPDSPKYHQKIQLMEHLRSKGVDFENHDFKLK